MKAVILAGGSGTRLYPTTAVLNKHLLPIYNKPMIYYPLSIVMLLGIRDIAIIVNPQDLNNFKLLLKDGSHLGLNITYIIQDKPRGLAEGLILAKDFIKDDYVFYLLGDNIFFGHDLLKIVNLAKEKVINYNGASIFCYHVKDPERFGIAEISEDGNYAVVGMYIYDKDAYYIAKNIKPSNRGELEITSVNEAYLQADKLYAYIFGRGFAWFDTGTHDSFIEASDFVATIEKRTGLMVGCIEEIAYKNGWIDKDKLLELAEPLKKTNYGKYLIEIAKET